MQLTLNHLMNVMVLFTAVLQSCISADEMIGGRGTIEDYCHYETFQSRCLKNEVIVMKSATYGRMQIGRCITAEEVDAQRRLAGDDPQILGCSADVLAILDKKCSGKTECSVRLTDIAVENIKPCFPGLVMYLEVSYECINVVDDKRSCSVSASKNPTHIIISSESQTNCGSKFQPWIVEAPVGQKVSISLLDFATSRSIDNGETKQLCNSRGIIMDKAAAKNVSICATGMQRIAGLYQSKGNKIEMFNNPSGESNIAMIKIEAVGCSDIIPPEDTWLKRNGDKIQIGCYSSRQTWQLNCREGKWVGVLGNCTQNFISQESKDEREVSEVGLHASISSEEQVLAIVAISGCTLAICLAIMCVGAVCLRRFYAQMKNKQDYKTLNCTINSARSRFMTQPNSTSVFTGSDAYSTDVQNAATYSVFVGETDVNETNVNPMRNSHVAHSDVAQ